MAVFKFRLNRKNSSGTYDTIHYETDSTVITRPNGLSAEEAFQIYDNMEGYTNVTTTFSNGEVSQQGDNFVCLTKFITSGYIEQELTLYGKHFKKTITFNDVSNSIEETFTEEA